MARFQSRGHGNPVEKPTKWGKPTDGNTCPLCGYTLSMTKNRQRMYCGNHFEPVGTPKFCEYGGYSLVTRGVAVGAATGDIEPLLTPSHEQLSIFQRAALFLTSACFLFIEALAGTGKSTVLVQLVRIMAQELGLSVLCLAFAARDKKVLEKRVMGRCKVYTSNGGGMYILGDFLRKNGHRRNLELDNGIPGDILRERLKADGLIKVTKGEGGKDEEKWEIDGNVYSAILTLDQKVRSCLPLAAAMPGIASKPTEKDILDLITRFDLEIATEDLPTVFNYVFYLFNELKSLNNVKVYGVDFTGQVFLPVYHNLTPPKRFKIVMVDETQDQNWTNRQLAKKFVDTDGGAMVVVGDRNQAIYAWRGADHNALDEMAREMAAMGSVERFPLTLCRRCAKAIIRMAQTIVPAIQALPGAPEGIVSDIPDSQSLFDRLKTERKGLVLCRMNAPLVSLCLKLLAAKVPAALIRGNVVQDLLRQIDQWTGRDNRQAVVDLLSIAKEWLSEKLAKFAKQRNGANKAQIDTDKVQCVEALVEADGIKTVADLKSLINSLFPEKRDEDGQVIPPDANEMVVLSTVHGAKGGEAHTVYLYNPDGMKVNCFDQVWSDAIDRDNTLYVAITRAEMELYCVGGRPTFHRFSDGDLELDVDEEAA